MVNRQLNFHISINMKLVEHTNNSILAIKKYQEGKRKSITNVRTKLVNKAHSAHILIKDGVGTLL